MDAQSPSKRFTRGSMSKSNTMQEIKSKLKNNPIRLEGMSAKSKQSNIKIVEGEENAKRKEVVVSGLLEHDEAVKFLGKREPTRIPHMQCYTNIEVMKVLATKLTSSQYKEFCGTTCFAQLSSIRRCHVQAQLIRCMLLREIEGSSKDAILIHVNGTTLRFTIRDFAIIAGLKCSDNEKDFVFNTEEPNRIILQYFGFEKAITKSQLVEKFDNKVWGDNDDDAVKFAILFYIHSFILSEEPTSTVIDRKNFDLVESGRYIDYPWVIVDYMLLLMQTISVMEMGFQIPSIQSSHVFNMLLYCGTMGGQKIQADATSDSKAPERPIRIHRDCDSSEKITIN
ncbi:hypothetical protein KY285_023359 [Solanum tuberosum]|nr:hypothetical protein KY289_025686 [Solanum tuberosum]KAH0675558.1 hypothetical protein KY285_023359 [Solanum tuberosum]